MSTVTHSITETRNHRFHYVVFKEKSGDRYLCIGSGEMKGLPGQTLKAVEAEAWSFIEGGAHWDAGTMSAHISIYEVLNLRSFVRNMADVWQPNDVERYEASEDLKNLQLTAEILSSDFSRCVIDSELSEAPQVLLILLSALMWVHTRRGLLTQLQP